MKKVLFLGAIVALLLFGCSVASKVEPLGTHFEKDEIASPFVMGTASLVHASASAEPEEKKKPEDRHTCPCQKDGKKCPCSKGECGHPACPTIGMSEKDKKATPKKDAKCPCPCDCGCCDGVCVCCRLSYEQGLAKAKADGKSLVLWVGVICPSIEKQLDKVVHAYEDKVPAVFQSNAKPPYVIVGRVQGGDVVQWRGFDNVPSIAAVNAAAGVRPVQNWRRQLPRHLDNPAQYGPGPDVPPGGVPKSEYPPPVSILPQEQPSIPSPVTPTLEPNQPRFQPPTGRGPILLPRGFFRGGSC